VERQQLLGLRLVGPVAAMMPLACLLGGCSQSATSATPSAAAMSALADVERHKDAVADLEYRLVEKCVTREGYDLLPPRPVAIPDLSPDGKLGIDQARDVGYGLRDLLRGPRTDRPPDAGSSSWQSATAHYRDKVTLAMFGPEDAGETYDFGGGSISMSSSGCYTEVRKQLYGDVQTYLKYNWIASNGLQAARAAEVGGAIDELDRKWSSCMSERGLDVSTPDAAREQAAAAYATQGVDAAFRSEREIAIRDAECRGSVGYDSTLAELQERGAATYLASHEADVIAYSVLLGDAERKGQEILGGGS
jgi:hypothetical protein